MTQPKPGEIYIEFVSIGSQVKAIAVDATTGLEVSVFGPASVSQSDLQNLAVRKLKKRLADLNSQQPRPGKWV
ncbi:MAG: serine hydroxymethyltransferase [Cohaesibacter sp.]|nr:serine hydroxymethyltransferase [Cohaesibacter sp.]MCV6603599.1 serine hydroxymethyltransferase [Cohaesibacter sp.]